MKRIKAPKRVSEIYCNFHGFFSLSNFIACSCSKCSPGLNRTVYCSLQQGHCTNAWCGACRECFRLQKTFPRSLFAIQSQFYFDAEQLDESVFMQYVRSSLHAELLSNGLLRWGVVLGDKSDVVVWVSARKKYVSKKYKALSLELHQEYRLTVVRPIITYETSFGNLSRKISGGKRVC